MGGVGLKRHWMVKKTRSPEYIGSVGVSERVKGERGGKERRGEKCIAQ